MSVIACKDTQHNHFTVKERQEMEPAKTADEWLNRLQLDLNNSSFGILIPRLYSEIPPIDHWQAITAKLDQITTDSASFQRFTKTEQHFQHDSEVNRLKIQLFSSLLVEDGTNTEPLYRSLLQIQNSSGALSSYRYDESLTRLLLLSNNQPESIEWFKKYISKGQNTHNSFSSSSNKSEKSAWKKALAENRIDEGIQLLLKAIKTAPVTKDIKLISNLATIAHLLDKPALGKQAMTMLEKSIIAHTKTNNRLSAYSLGKGFNYYAHQKQWDKLYRLCKKITNIKSSKKKTSNYNTSIANDLLHFQLTALFELKRFDEFEKKITTTIKHHTDQPKAVFSLLEKNVADCPSVGALYIDILSQKNDLASKELAYKFCTHLLARNQGKDAYYKRAIKLNPETSTTFIASLRKYDPFEERPLIWQAEMALQAEELDKADALIQQAIALDPSDGDHGKFSRMLCYDVLSRILEKQGNPEKAKFFKEVVFSIRQGEIADDFLYAGLTQEATDRYKEALGHFNDAYCLQSRLAKTLMEAGKFHEAVPHFKKAFELMPVSFGPRESHCFGCEGLFDDKRVQNIALPTLKAFLEKEPANPRTPYLLGLLFEEMKKDPEAIAAYQKAIELDPQYYNAAKNLYRLISKDLTNYNQAVKLKRQLFEIAPYQRKAAFINSPHLLKSYWKLAQNFPPSPIKLAPLIDLGIDITTKKLSDKQFIELQPNESSYRSSHYHNSDDALDGWSAKEVLMKNSFLNDGF
ncbi:MAG: tetratricopeptide (TPR) repeat protein [Cryomorphaceae bacterium]|jgi:tetratricopeptide (TPR) repeat protein